MALSLVQKLLKQYRQTQDISPQTNLCSGLLKLTPSQLVILAELIELNNDATLEELCCVTSRKSWCYYQPSDNGKNDTELENYCQKKRSFRRVKAPKGFKTSDMSSGS